MAFPHAMRARLRKNRGAISSAKCIDGRGCASGDVAEEEDRDAALRSSPPKHAGGTARLHGSR
jgi:hypothetical protein